MSREEIAEAAALWGALAGTKAERNHALATDHFAGGVSIKDCAAKYGISYSRARQIITASRHRGRRRAVSNPTADALRAAGQRYREALREMAQGPGANPWAEALRQARADAIEEAAKLAEDMAFDAVALRIRRLGGAS